MRAHGAIAQLGERCNRTAEVVSSNLIGSTKNPKEHSDLGESLIIREKSSYQIATSGSAAKVASALDLWLSGFASDNTRRAYAREISTFAGFAGRQNVAQAIADFLALEDGQAHAVADAWRARKLQDGLSPASINRSMAATPSMATIGRREPSPAMHRSIRFGDMTTTGPITPGKSRRPLTPS